MTALSIPTHASLPRAPRGATVRIDGLPQRVVAATTELLQVMGLEGRIVCRDRRRDKEPRIWVEILSADSGLLIGDHGSTLQALEHILRLLLRPLVGEGTRVSVDVNAYRARRMELLRRRAQDAARRARVTGRAVVLDPMSPADRRLVHVALAEEEGITTASEGEEPHRRVIVRPADPLA